MWGKGECLEETDRRIVVVVSSLTAFLTPFAASSFNIALPTISREFGLDAISMSWASLAYLLTSAMLLVPFGKLADMYGRKRVFIYGVSIFTVASLLLSFYPSSFTLILLRVMQGVGTSMIFGTSVAILVSVFPPERRGAVLGVNAASVYVGLSVGPYIGGILTQSFGWRSIFLCGVGLGAAIVALTLWRVRGEWVEARGERFDLLGSAVYGLTLLCIMYGFSLLPQESSYIPLAAGVAGLAAFLWVESRARNPVLDINLFRSNMRFTFSSLATFINFGATYAVNYLLSLYLQYLKGLSPIDAGLVLIASPVVQAFCSPVAGRLSDRIEPGKLASIGMAITVIGLLPFILLDGFTSILFVVCGLAVIGFGLSLFASPNTNAIMSSVDSKYYGVASSTTGTMRLTGQMLSMGITMILFAVNIGQIEIRPEVYPQLLASVHSAFIIFSVLCVLGVFASLVGDRKGTT
jgi:EmrB/QacA subfamily drug resistance transporter